MKDMDINNKQRKFLQWIFLRYPHFKYFDHLSDVLKNNTYNEEEQVWLNSCHDHLKDIYKTSTQ